MTEKWLINDWGMTEEWLRDDWEMTEKWLRNDWEMTEKWLINDWEMTEKWLTESLTFWYLKGWLCFQLLKWLTSYASFEKHQYFKALFNLCDKCTEKWVYQRQELWNLDLF